MDLINGRERIGKDPFEAVPGALLPKEPVQLQNDVAKQPGSLELILHASVGHCSRCRKLGIQDRGHERDIRKLAV